jgi:hypothetical protein
MQFTKWEDLSEHEQLLGLYSDMYKDAYGVRPQGYSDLTVYQLKHLIDRLEAIIIEQIEAERD